MPPDPDDEFVRTLAITVVDLLAAVERGDKLALIGHLNLLLTAITERGTVETRRGDALARAVMHTTGG